MKEEYEALLKSGMFWILFPDLSGKWEDDMVNFIEWKAINHSHLIDNNS